MKRWILVVMAVALGGILALVFVYPAPMLSPGQLIAAHASLENTCFACHVPMQGAVAARCTSCHAVADIGLVTVAGTPVSRKTPVTPFHQGLSDTDCMGCHTDHPMASLTPPHSHSFAHVMLLPAVAAGCANCHKPPTDGMHVAPVAQCSTCHTQKTWAAAAIDHTRFFALTGPHDAACTTCHTTANDFAQYSCFGCHEHQQADMIREHQKEGISNIANCVSCHRNAHGEGDEGGESREGGEERQDDD
ncbi:MAG: hypothetical protein K9G43_11035 [Rhodobacteraceae bacterium]|nr:hypothetical protein [Paracoccaceae bacterium]